MWTGEKRKMWKRSFGTHGDVRQRSVQVHVTCANRPTWSVCIDGCCTGAYGRKLVLTRRRDGSTQRVSATTATDAVTESPKRCTVGVSVA